MYAVQILKQKKCRHFTVSVGHSPNAVLIVNQDPPVFCPWPRSTNLT